MWGDTDGSACTRREGNPIEEKAEELSYVIRVKEDNSSLIRSCPLKQVWLWLQILGLRISVWIDDWVHVFDERWQQSEFDLMMVTQSGTHAIEVAETSVRHEGIVYLFAGLNMSSMGDMDLEDLFFYKRLHRTARGVFSTAGSVSANPSCISATADTLNGLLHRR